jgi:hypothetical protein
MRAFPATVRSDAKPFLQMIESTDAERSHAERRSRMFYAAFFGQKALRGEAVILGSQARGARRCIDLWRNLQGVCLLSF